MSTNYTGKTFGRLTVLSLANPTRHPGGQLSKTWNCSCSCGNTKVITDRSLRKGTKSCGCLISEAAKLKATHGKTDSTEHRIWRAMKDRCLNPNNDAYDRYGGRGISVCSRWESFSNFLADMGERPNDFSLDRIDVNGNYSPENCRWATKEQQANNTRSNRFITFQGETLTLAQWERKLGLPAHILSQRLGAHGWSEEKALTTPRINSRYEHRGN